MESKNAILDADVNKDWRNQTYTNENLKFDRAFRVLERQLALDLLIASRQLRGW